METIFSIAPRALRKDVCWRYFRTLPDFAAPPLLKTPSTKQRQSSCQLWSLDKARLNASLKGCKASALLSG
jgi:hypothetical protein